MIDSSEIERHLTRIYKSEGQIAPTVFMVDNDGKTHAKNVDMEENRYEMMRNLGREWAIFMPLILGLASEIWYLEATTDQFPVLRPSQSPERNEGISLTFLAFNGQCYNTICPIKNGEPQEWIETQNCQTPLLEEFWRGVADVISRSKK